MSGALIHFPDKGVWQLEEFTSNGTYNVPPGITTVYLYGCGGGGGGGGGNDGTATPANGSTGSSTLFGGLATFRGGDGGARSTGAGPTDKAFNIRPHSGGNGRADNLFANVTPTFISELIASPGAGNAFFAGGSPGDGGGGGAGPFGTGGNGGTSAVGANGAVNTGAGGGGGGDTALGGQGGGGAILGTQLVIVTPAAAIAITIGGGGSGGAGGVSGFTGGSGGSGKLTVYWINPN